MNKSIPITKVQDRAYEALDALGEIIEVDPQAGNDAIVRTLGLLDELHKLVGELKSAHETELVNRIGDRGEVQAGNYVAEIKPRPVRHRTDWPLLLPNALDRITANKIVNESTGEIETDCEAIARQLPDLVSMTPSAKPKTTGLAALGIDRDAYTECEWTAPKVTLTRKTVDDEGEVAA